MQSIVLKPQIPFVTKLPPRPEMLAASKPTIGGRPSQVGSSTGHTNKTSQTIDYSSRIYSPYLTSSSIQTESRQLAQDGMSSVYQHNVAATKYFNVSFLSILRPQSRLSLIA
jgi:hypothetical protein